MRVGLPGNRFELHWERFDATYDSDGTMILAYYKATGKRRRMHVPFSHRKVRAWAEEQGLQEWKLLNAGILTVKPE